MKLILSPFFDTESFERFVLYKRNLENAELDEYI